MTQSGIRLARDDDFDFSFAPKKAPVVAATIHPLGFGEVHDTLSVARPLDLGLPRDLAPSGPSMSPTQLIHYSPFASTLPSLAPPVSPSLTQQITFLTGLNPNGTLNTGANNSFWGFNDSTARKWGPPTADTPGVVRYFFDLGSDFTPNEENTFLKAFGLWEAVCGIDFQETSNRNAADVVIERGDHGSAFFSGETSNGSGSTLGSYTEQTLISIDDSTPGFELTGSLDTFGGYGMSTVIHEVGHMVGLGHGGYYNGTANEATQQYSAFDERQWTIMSYIGWTRAETAKYRDSYTPTGTFWGFADDGSNAPRDASHTWMPLDIIAAQWLYGAPAANSALNGGDTFGFNTTVTGQIKQFFDFTKNEHPVITLFSTGTGNTFDCSGFAFGNFIDLRPLGFSSTNVYSVDQQFNNIVIDANTVIETGIGGAGSDTIVGNDSRNNLVGGGEGDFLIGGAGRDRHNGGGASDWAEYSDSPAGVIVDLATPANNTGYARGDTFKSIENLWGSGFDDTLTGDDAANILFGNAGADRLLGGGGVDSLIGGSGKDTLSGQGSKDFFILDSTNPADADVITDFGGADEVSLFGPSYGLADGDLQASRFVLGTAAGDANDRIIYQKSTGKLWFDPDGSGAQAKVLIATFTNNPTLAATDFDVFTG